MNESLRVLRPCRSQGAFALLEDALGAAVMDVTGGEHGDTAMTVLGVVPGKERAAERDRGGDIGEATGEAVVILQGLDTCASEKGLSSLTWGRLSERVTPRSASSWAVHLLYCETPILRQRRPAAVTRSTAPEAPV